MKSVTRFSYLLVLVVFLGMNQMVEGVPQLSYSTFLSGSTTSSEGKGIAVDAAGNIYVIGYFVNVPFPTTTNAYSTTFGGGDQDVFVCKINPNYSGSSSLVFSTYIGGNSSDEGNGITLDTAGNIYIVGDTYSTDFPMSGNSYQTTNTAQAVYVCKINPNLSGVSTLLYSTYLGTTNTQYGTGIALDTSGNIYITGYTNSNKFPVTSNAYDTSYNGLEDAFISKFNISLSGTSSLVYSTFLGGTSYDESNSIAVTPQGKVWVCGLTLSSTDFPVTPNACNTTYHGSEDMFICEVNPNISGSGGLEYSTILGGNYDGQNDSAQGVAVDSSGNAYVTGVTEDTTFPITSNAYQKSFIINGYHAVVLKINPSLSGITSLVYSTLLEGNSSEGGFGIVLDKSGNVYVTGFTFSTTFPVTGNAYQSTNHGIDDAFITKLNLSLSGSSSLIYSTYLGGENYDGGESIAVDTGGNIYITGFSYSSTFPATGNAFDTTNHEAGHNRPGVFVSKIVIPQTVPVEDWMMYGTEEKLNEFNLFNKVNGNH